MSAYQRLMLRMVYQILAAVTGGRIDTDSVAEVKKDARDMLQADRIEKGI